MSVNYAYNININSSCFTGNRNITEVDCRNLPWVGDASDAFYGCTNLISVTNMASSYSMTTTFYGCTNLVNMPIIPNYTSHLCYTFGGCSNLTNPSTLPNSVTDISFCFSGCPKLIASPNIPAAVTNMESTFEFCFNLTGNIYIESENITTAANCFNCYDSPAVLKQKNVYIPFRYSNGIYTETYNSFTTAGYDTLGTTNNVYLIDSSPAPITKKLDVENYNYTLVNNYEVTLTKYIGQNTIVAIPELEEN